MVDATKSHPWYKRIGPGLITACVVIGPGSILTSSNVGARYGYGLSWVVIVAVFFMLVYMSMGARLGATSKESAGTILSQHLGRPFAVLIGISVFFISAAFQFGNNLGVHYALANYVDLKYIIVLFNGLAIAFLLVFRDMYKALERLMSIFVGLMLICFLLNLCFAGPRLGEWGSGFIPGASVKLDLSFLGLSVLGLVGTTFVVSAAFYQSYLVQQKGWTRNDLKYGIIDVRVGALIMAAITLMLMATPATVFHPQFKHQQVVTSAGGTELVERKTLIIDDADAAVFQRIKQAADSEVDWKDKSPRWSAILPKGEFLAAYPAERFPDLKADARTFRDLPEVGTALQPLFGGIGPPLFFVGVFAAAYSSFLVNSMIGGFILADGLGIGSSPTDTMPKVFTITVLLTGMCVGLYAITTDQSPVQLIIAAQATTVIASPLVAGSLLWMTSSKRVMGQHANNPLQLALGWAGLLLLVAMSVSTSIKLAPKIMPSWFV